jgi:hypothetical protein
VTLWELWHRADPHADAVPAALLPRLLDEPRPPVAPGCPPAFAALLLQCWRPAPAARPSFLRLHDQLLAQFLALPTPAPQTRPASPLPAAAGEPAASLASPPRAP